MQIQVLIPSQNQRSFTVNVDRDETVASFRKLLCKTLKVAEDTFLLIAMGKIASIVFYFLNYKTNSNYR